MRLRFLLSLTLAGAAIVLLQTRVEPAHAQGGPQAAVTGLVSAAEEGPLEGVLVSARKAGSPITITVVTDVQGRYRFPQARLEPGQYALRIRAAVSVLRRSGLLNAKETAALLTPASRATSAIRARGTGTSDTSLLRLLGGRTTAPDTGPLGRQSGAQSTGLANRFSGR